VAPITQELIRPGETYTYEFTVHKPAMSMHHAQGQEAIPNGLFGTIFIGEVPIPSGRTVSGIEVPAAVEIAQNLPMVLNDSGVIGLSLDGKSFPATARVVAKLGDWIQVLPHHQPRRVRRRNVRHGHRLIVDPDPIFSGTRAPPEPVESVRSTVETGPGASHQRWRRPPRAATPR